jgi:hypothetical protein
MSSPCELCKIQGNGENDGEPRGFAELVHDWHFIFKNGCAWVCVQLENLESATLGVKWIP